MILLEEVSKRASLAQAGMQEFIDTEMEI